MDLIEMELIEALEICDEAGRASVRLVLEQFAVGREMLARDLADLFLRARDLPGGDDTGEPDIELLRRIKGVCRPPEALLWGRTYYQIKTRGDSELVAEFEALMQRRTAS